MTFNAIVYLKGLQLGKTIQIPTIFGRTNINGKIYRVFYYKTHLLCILIDWLVNMFHGRCIRSLF